jgi:hypothetical protein
VAIDSKTAADVARRHGLTLSDANALRSLADSERAADELAFAFAHPEETDPHKLAARLRS